MKKTIIFLVVIILLVILLLFSWQYIFSIFAFQVGPNFTCFIAHLKVSIVQDSNTCIDSKYRISVNLKGGVDSGLEGLDITANMKNGSHIMLQGIPGQELPAAGKK
jgi:hypothetical protein